MKFRVQMDEEELTIFTEDGGVACIRVAEPISDDEERIATTDYYQSRIDLSDPECTSDNLWEYLGEGKLYHEDWAHTKYNSLKAIQHALDWLCVGNDDWELSEDLFEDFLNGK